MRAMAVTTLLLVGALAGCFQADEAPADLNETAGGGNVTIDESRPDPVFEDVVTGPSAQPDAAATLAAAPELRVGEWWRVQLHDPFTGEDTEFIRVLAAIQGDTYVFGMPHEGWWKEAVVFHTPAFGDVNKADLSYNTHDILFTPLKFPLEDGQSWETEFSGGGVMTAAVEVMDETRAKITFTSAGGGGPFGPVNAALGGGGDNVVLELIYDAAIHEVVEFNHGTVQFTVVDHGYDFEGWVTVPRGEQLVFFHGRIGPGIDLNTSPAPPVETVSIAGGFNRMSFITVAQAVGPAGGPSCSETATGPDGTTYATDLTPCAGFRIDFHEAKEPDGDWSLQHVAGGAAVVFIEGIAYHQYDIHLPDGAIRSDHSHEVVR
jgi:hypothetical protein